MDAVDLLSADNRLGAWAENEDSNDGASFAAAVQALHAPRAPAAAAAASAALASELHAMAENSRDGINLLFKTVRGPSGAAAQPF